MSSRTNPVARAIASCMACPPTCALRTAAILMVVGRLMKSRYKQDAAEDLGVSNEFLSRLLSKYPELKPTKEPRK